MEHRAGEQGSVAIKIRDETNINVQGAKGWKKILNVRTAEKIRNDRFGNYQKVESILSGLDNGTTTYRKVFKNVYLAQCSLRKI